MIWWLAWLLPGADGTLEGYPSPLDESVAAGRARVLGPGERTTSEVTAVLFGGVGHVSDLLPDGSVRP
jgi:hypothetical protein